MTADKANQYPIRMGNIFMQGMEEILGKNEVKEVLGQADLMSVLVNPSIETLGRLQNALEGTYGSRSGCGLALRVGRASFKYGLREFGSQLGLTDLAFRLLPLGEKIKKGSEALAELVHGSTGQNVTMERDGNSLSWKMDRCPLCDCGKNHEGRPAASEGPCCQLVVGLLQEALFWLSSGKFFEIRQEKSNSCSSSSCKILINLSPIA